MIAAGVDHATITLEEYQERLIDLVPEDIDYIRSSLARRISISRPLDGPGWLVNPMQHAGVVVLPSGRRLVCKPKVPVRNFFTMLAIAFDLDPGFLSTTTTFERIDEVFEFVIRYFAELVDERIHLGLYRSYTEREESIPAVRGRIAIEEDMRRNHITRHMTHCRFTEFTRDIPENQIIRQVVHMVSRWVDTPALRGHLQLLDHRLGEVSPVALPASALDRFAYHRLNDDYRPIHRLCRLFIAGSGLSEDEGHVDFRTFLFDMNDLFERFVTKLLDAELQHPLRVAAQPRIELGTRGEVPMNPDIVVFRHGLPVLVIDCKYKRLAPAEAKNHDVYQLVAYCTALAAEDGLLIYPRHEHAVDSAFDVRNVGIRIRQVTIDLGVQDGFLAHCQAFASSAVPRNLVNRPHVEPAMA